MTLSQLRKIIWVEFCICLILEKFGQNKSIDLLIFFSFFSGSKVFNFDIS